LEKAKMTKAIAPIDEVRNSLSLMGDQFKMVLPPHIPLERFVRVAITAVQNTPALLEADRKSLYGACMKSAQDGLIPDGKEAALVVFKGQVQYMPMIAGILKKVRNSGELLSLTSQVVYENDAFDYWVDQEGEHINHRPYLDGERGNVRLAYAIANTKEGGLYVEFMTEKQLQDVRSMSRAKDGGPWAGVFADEMRRKTVVRRLSKRLPMSTDLEQVLQRDDDLYDVSKPIQQEQPAPEKPKQSRLKTVMQVPDEEQTVEDIVTSEEQPPVVDEPVKESMPAPAGAKRLDLAEVTSEVSIKNGSSTRGPWTLYKTDLNNELYSSFSSTVGALLQQAYANGSRVNVIYKEKVNGTITNREIISAELSPDDQELLI
jgi:recombination protein RecT